MKSLFKWLFALLLSWHLGAQNVNYYSSINTNATGTTLETALANLITTTHTNNISYSTAFQLLKDANEDANNTNNVILIYSSVSDPKVNTYGGGGTGNISTGWTREHVFPKSLANPNLGTSGPGADAHNLAPCTNSINGARGNKKYEAGSGSYGSVSSNGWYPGDDWRGDVARIIFYMDLRYGNQCDLSDVSTLSLLLQWNAADPVSSIEDQRNDEIFLVQGNRNPFIDNPIFATRIWGGPTAQDRFSGAIADPQSLSFTASTNSISFTATANLAGDDVMLAYTNANGSFGTPSGSYSAGNTLSGGGTVHYVGPANNIPSHTGLASSTVYKYKIWSVDAVNNYSNGIEQSTSTTGGALISLYKNSFEGSPDDTWAYTANPLSYNTSGDIWDIQGANGSINSGSDGNQFWAIRDLNNPNGGGNFFHQLEFQSIDISSASNVSLSFDYYAEAFESSDELEYELIYDGQSQGTTTIFQGGTGGLSSNGWTNVNIQIPDNVNQLEFKLRAKQDGGSDYGGFDNIILESAINPPALSVSAYSPTAAQVQLTANSENDSILVVYGSGTNLVFSGASGLFQVGQNFQGIATVAYFGPARNLNPITRLSEGGNYTFAAYSFNGQSYSAPISQNLSLPTAEGTGTSLLYFQGFEGNSSDTWAIQSGSSSISANIGAADFPPNERILSGANSWQVNNGSQSLELATVSSSAADSLTLILNLSSTALTSGNGADGADYIRIYLDINNSGFPANPDLTINGNNNAKWGFGSYSTGSGTNTSSGIININSGQNSIIAPSAGGYQSSDAYHIIQFGLNNVSSLALRIEVRNNSSNEIWNIDDISLYASSNALVWNGSEWKNNESPDQNSDNRNLIIYPGEDAELISLAEVQSLDIRNGANLIISPQASLKVNSIQTADGNMLLEADNSGSASYIGPPLELTKEYYFSRSGWHPISFPFSDIRFQDLEFTNGGFINYASGPGLSTCNTCNLFYYDADITNSSNIGVNGTSAYGTWIAVDDSTDLISQNHGFYIFLGPSNFGQIPMVLSAKGTSRSGNINISTQDGNGGWNLIPNPFPTALEWSNKTDFASEGFDQSYWIYNGSNFATYNGGVGINGADGFIPSGQAFFIHSATPLQGAPRNNRNFGFGQNIRAQNNRGRHKSLEAEVLRLEAAIDTIFRTEIALSFDLTAQEEVLGSEDAWLAGEIDERSFYFDFDGQALSILKSPPRRGTQVFPLGIGNELMVHGELVRTSDDYARFYYILDNKNQLIELQWNSPILLSSLSGPLQLLVSDRALTNEEISTVFWTLQKGELLVHSILPWKRMEVHSTQGELIFQTQDFQQDFLIPKTLEGILIIRLEFENGVEILKALR